jgi:hypothetical protein
MSSALTMASKRTASFSSAIVADHLPMNTFVTRHLVVRVTRD